MQDRPIVTKAEAKAAGLKRYFTGEPCKHGHVDERIVSSTACMSCSRETCRIWREANPEAVRENNQRWYAENGEAAREGMKRWYAENAEAKRENNHRWYAENGEAAREGMKRWYAENADEECEKSRLWREENPEASREITRRWQAANPAAVAAIHGNRRAAKIHRTPAWADLKEIEAIYAECRLKTGETQVQHHVDHIVPLRGKRVSGLHVPWNLQVIPAKENLKKGNRHAD